MDDNPNNELGFKQITATNWSGLDKVTLQWCGITSVLRSNEDWIKFFHQSRQEYFCEMWQKFGGVNLVSSILIMLEVTSKRKGWKNSCKYLYWDEFVNCFKRGCSVLVYQHFCREKRDSFIKKRAQKILRATNAAVYSFRIPRVVSFLAAQAKHQNHFDQAVSEW